MACQAVAPAVADGLLLGGATVGHWAGPVSQLHFVSYLRHLLGLFWGTCGDFFRDSLGRFSLGLAI